MSLFEYIINAEIYMLSVAGLLVIIGAALYAAAYFGVEAAKKLIELYLVVRDVPFQRNMSWRAYQAKLKARQ